MSLGIVYYNYYLLRYSSHIHDLDLLFQFSSLFHTFMPKNTDKNLFYNCMVDMRASHMTAYSTLLMSVCFIPFT